MGKPKFLYHASFNKSLDMIEPKNYSIRNSTEGQVIFAGEDPKGLSVFLVPSNDTWTSLGTFSFRDRKTVGMSGLRLSGTDADVGKLDVAKLGKTVTDL